MRLDKFLLKYSALSWNHIQKILRTPKFYVHNIQIPKNYKFKVNDLLEYPINISLTFENPMAPTGFQNMFKESIIFEDSNLIAINKPSGLASQGGVKIKLSADILANEYKGGKLMHRLDKSVSGLLLFGKSKEACNLPFTQKTYLAILCGNIQSTGQINNKIAQIGRLQQVSEFGKQALTHYKTLENLEYEGQKYSFVQIQIETGRKHQIRVHCSQILNCPILGDTQYGGNPADRIYLHSYSCLINETELKAELQPDFSSTLKKMGFKSF